MYRFRRGLTTDQRAEYPSAKSLFRRTDATYNGGSTGCRSKRRASGAITVGVRDER
jgi:hypothetical protein